DPTGALLIGRLMLDCIRKHNIQADAIGGLTIGADPIATAVAVVSALEGQPLPAFIVRKETKGHGTQRLIEGYDGKPGSRVIVVDREEGGAELIAKRYPFYALFTAKELLKDA